MSVTALLHSPKAQVPELPNPEAPSAVRLLNGLLALRLLPDLARALEDAAATAPEGQRLALYCEASRARDLLRETT